MNRPSAQTISLLTTAALCSVGAAVLSGTLAGGCVYGSNETPQSSVCSALAGYFQSCAVSSACNAAYVRDCEKVSAALSGTAVNSVFACAENGQSCKGAPVALVSACAVDGYKNVTLSTAQLQLASDYCHACAPSDPNCTRAFYDLTGGAGDTILSLTLAGDTTVSRVDSTCISTLLTDAGAAACLTSFSACATPIAAAGLYIPPECISDAGIADGSIAPVDGG